MAREKHTDATSDVEKFVDRNATAAMTALIQSGYYNELLIAARSRVEEPGEEVISADADLAAAAYSLAMGMLAQRKLGRALRQSGIG